ncbi:hypothetical protein LTR66_017610, partial [Elasticomyces elasticus]
VGRRNLLLIGAAGGSVCLWIVGAYIKIAQPEKNNSDSLTGGGIAAMFFFYLWTEMFDPNMRSLAQACAAASNWLWNFLISRFTPQMFSAMGYGVYFFFASLMMCSIVFVYFLVPETKGLSLEQVDHMMEESTPRTSAAWRPSRTFAGEMGAIDGKLNPELVQDVERKGSIY